MKQHPGWAGPISKERKTLEIRFQAQGEYQEIVNAAKASGMSNIKCVRTKLIAAARRA